MSRAAVLCLILIAGICFVPCTAPGHALDDPLVVRVGVYENPPKVFTDDGGDVRGLFPDVIEYIAGEEGWTLEYVEGNWTECLERLDSNEIDIMVDVAISDDRLEKYAFSNESMLLSWGVVYSQRDVHVDSIPELDGLRMAVMTDSIHTTGDEGILSLVDKFLLNVTVVECDDYGSVFEALEAGEADVGVVNRIFGSMYGEDYDVVRTPIIFNPTDLRYAAPRNSTIAPYLLEKIDAHLVQLKSDSSSIYYESLRTYIPNLFEDEDVVAGWLMPALFASFGVLAVIVSMNLLLRHQVKGRTAELRRAYDALVSEKNRSELYLDLMSHDIANIDQGIYTYAELADRESVDNPELRMYMDGILMQAKRAVKLIAAVRLLSSLNREPLRPGSLDLVGVLEASIDETVKAFPKDRVKVKFTPPNKAIMISAEPLVGEIFRNLLNNAVRHQRREEKEIEVEVVHEVGTETVVVSISDHGPGIPDEMKSKLLQRFETTLDVRLSGIGLALVKELVERYQGTIEIKDRVGGDPSKGARFEVAFPICRVRRRARLQASSRV